MYFGMKSYLKSTRNYTAKHALRHLKKKIVGARRRRKQFKMLKNSSICLSIVNQGRACFS